MFLVSHVKTSVVTKGATLSCCKGILQFSKAIRISASKLIVFLGANHITPCWTEQIWSFVVASLSWMTSVLPYDTLGLRLYESFCNLCGKNFSWASLLDIENLGMRCFKSRLSCIKSFNYCHQESIPDGTMESVKFKNQYSSKWEIWWSYFIFINMYT